MKILILFYDHWIGEHLEEECSDSDKFSGSEDPRGNGFQNSIMFLRERI